MKTPSAPAFTQGQSVWVVYCYERRDRTITAKVRELIFDHVCRDYMGKKGDNRLGLVLPGSPFGQGYGTAYKRADVYRTRDAAVIALRKKVAERINAWRAALDSAW
jgi:hypothetical protein